MTTFPYGPADVVATTSSFLQASQRSDDPRQAAVLRSRSVTQASNRPSRRRSAADPESRTAMHAPLSGVEIRSTDAGDALVFSGVASATERAYEMWDMFGPYTEIVSHDAFDASLARDDLDVPLVLDHRQLRRIARTTLGTLRLSMTEPGLTVDADLDGRDLDVQYIVPKLRAGLIDEMSFAFRIVSGQWSPDYTEYRITEVDLHRGDVAIVGWGANPHTTAELRQQRDPRETLAAYLEAAIAAHR
ncbi:MAG: HK97 family phage prohead protease [Candidatus Nanopelagicales bacterium]